MKPTYGRVSRYGITAYSSSLDQCGPITQNVEDAAILYDIISGYDPMDSTSANIDYEAVTPKLNSDKKLTIAVIDNFVSQASPAIQKAFENTRLKKGLWFVEIVSNCNSGWKMTPNESNIWMEEHMFPYFPLGDIKVDGKLKLQS